LIGAATFLLEGVGVTESSLLGLLLLEGYEYNQSLNAVLVIRFFALWYVIFIGVVFTLLYKISKKHEGRRSI